MENESLTHTVDFGIGSAFSKGPRSVLSEGPFGSNGDSTPILHYDTSHRLRYVHLRYMKCLFTNIQKQ